MSGTAENVSTPQEPQTVPTPNGMQAPFLSNLPYPTPINNSNNNTQPPHAELQDAQVAPFAGASVKPETDATAQQQQSQEPPDPADVLRQQQQQQQLQYHPMMTMANQLQYPQAAGAAAQTIFASFMQSHAAATAPKAAAATLVQQQQQRPTYVNAKQFHRILRRRETRAILQEHYRKQVAGDEGRKKPYQHESRHRHAVKRPRGPHGRFLRKDELPAYYMEHPEEDPSNPDNVLRMQREAEASSKRAKTEAATSTN